MFFEPYAADIASRLRDMSSGRLLETACGTGILTRALAAALPGTVAITATDLNEPMLDFAKLQPGGERVQWQQADAQNLPFPEQTFDAVVCQFGVMFFPDTPRAYREVFRVLKPGGRFLFSVWDRIETNDMAFFVHKALMKMFPDDPPMFIEAHTDGVSRHRESPGRPRRLRLQAEHRRYPQDALPYALGAAPSTRAHSRIAPRRRGHHTSPLGARQSRGSGDASNHRAIRSRTDRGQHAGAYLHRNPPAALRMGGRAVEIGLLRTSSGWAPR
jgi:SAM-dependent methyltransferase